MKKLLLKLEEKRCGDVWLRVTPSRGPLASINLGKRGDYKCSSIVQRALLAAIEEQDHPVQKLGRRPVNQTAQELYQSETGHNGAIPASQMKHFRSRALKLHAIFRENNPEGWR